MLLFGLNLFLLDFGFGLLLNFGFRFGLGFDFLLRLGHLLNRLLSNLLLNNLLVVITKRSTENIRQINHFGDLLRRLCNNLLSKLWLSNHLRHLGSRQRGIELYRLVQLR